MDKAASSKVIMNKEQLLLFVENKRKEKSRRDLELSMDKTESCKVIMSKEDSRRVSLLPVETESDFKLSKVIMTEEDDASRGFKTLHSAFAAWNSKRKMLVEQDSAPSI